MVNCFVQDTFALQRHPENAGELALSGHIGTGEAAALLDALKQSLAEGEHDFTLDLSETKMLGTAAVQVLLAAQKTASAAGRRFRIARWSSEVQEIFFQLGIAEEATGGDLQ